MKIVLLICCLLHAAITVCASDSEWIFCQAELSRALSSNNADSLATAYAHCGEYYAYRDADSTRYYCRMGLKYADRSCSEPYLFLLSNLANAYISSGDLGEGRRLLWDVLDEADRLDCDSSFRATALTSIGVTYRLQEKPDSALLCYNQALALLQNQKAYGEEAHLLTSIAILYANTSRLKEAMSYAGRAMRAADRCDDIDMVFYAHTTAGSIQVLRGDYAEATRLIHPVLSKARRQQKPGMELKCLTFLLGMFQRSGQCDSLECYMRQADRALARVPAESTEVVGYLETLYMILADEGRYHESLRIQQRLLDGPNRNQLGSISRLYLHMARNHRALHEYECAADCYERAYEASDSLHAAAVEAQLSELTVKYKTQEKELEIARLSEQHLKQRAQLMQWIAVASGLFFLLLALTLWYVFHWRRVRREEELKLARSYIDGMENERARLAKDLHDGVCNDLLGIGMQIQCSSATEVSAQVVDLLEQVRLEVRNISHELMPPRFKCTTLDEMLEEYVERFPSSDKVSICFSKQNEGGDWAGIPEQVAYEIYRVVQELLSNIVRHADASSIRISLCVSPSLLTLCVADDGQALSVPIATEGKGIGLDSIRERTKTLGGTLSVNTGESGQTFCLRVPLSPRKP